MRIKKTFDFHADPGHGWLKVPMSYLDILGIRGMISAYSYQRGQNAYLEEDCDAPLFIQSYRGKYGRDPKIRHHLCDNRSLIRGYTRFGTNPYAGYSEFFRKHGFG